MALCVKCFKREQQFIFKQYKAIKKDSKLPKKAKFIICSNCLQNLLKEKNYENIWEIKL